MAHPQRRLSTRRLRCRRRGVAIDETGEDATLVQLRYAWLPTPGNDRH